MYSHAILRMKRINRNIAAAVLHFGYYGIFNKGINTHYFKVDYYYYSYD